MRFVPAIVTGLFVLAGAAAIDAAPQSKKGKAGPETFNAKASVGSEAGRGDAYVTVRIDQYTTEKNLGVMERASRRAAPKGF